MRLIIRFNQLIRQNTEHNVRHQARTLDIISVNLYNSIISGSKVNTDTIKNIENI